ncbi:MAG: FAD binding domain-containing protein [Flavobacteriales bacterium]|jgi:xanthine dehydrogenase small subunit|nr:FAD binding domain-containing protein [Flavobacteriales bacterium]
MTRFILNDVLIETPAHEGTVLLDVIRYHQHLPGTKVGCREGDCGACTVLVGEMEEGRLVYRSMTSCLLALANIRGKHVVTVEGLNMGHLSPVQQALVDENGTQCGFCTPGFVVSLSGCCLSREMVTPERAIRAVDGNICRCTGYKSIERAATSIAQQLATKNTGDPVTWSVEHGFLPAYFKTIPDRLKAIRKQPGLEHDGSVGTLLGGGTDLYVQKHDSMHHSAIRPLGRSNELKGIRIASEQCVIGGGCVANDLLASEELHARLPQLEEYLLLISSTPIRNMGTVAGNLVNASPIGDLTVLFLALDSTIRLAKAPDRPEHGRNLKLRDLYKGYKLLDKAPDEIVTTISFNLPDKQTRIHFEKVSKRTHLDIASVNSAIRLEISRDATGSDMIREAHVSAGGVAPVPKYLTNTSAFLVGRSVDLETVRAAYQVMAEEVTPISDARGTAEYKRLLLRQLFFAHFMHLFPERFTLKQLVA